MPFALDFGAQPSHLKTVIMATKCVHLAILLVLSIMRVGAFLHAPLFVSRRSQVASPSSHFFSARDDSVSSSKEADGPIVDRDVHVRVLNDSLERHIGKGIRDFTGTSCEEADCWDDIHTSTRYALHSNGATNDLDGPVNNYGNFGALGAFEMTYPQFTRMPASRMANPGLDQEEWSQVLQRVQSMGKEGFLQNYQGFRCTVNQTPFFIRDALVSLHIICATQYQNLHHTSQSNTSCCRSGIASTTTASIADKPSFSIERR